MQAYWPFHKLHCHRNEFADQTEESEPKFAAWMRKHGKMAVLKDDEVDRLERASTAVSGPTRQSVMESMYGRLNPKPAGTCEMGAGKVYSGVPADSIETRLVAVCSVTSSSRTIQ